MKIYSDWSDDSGIIRYGDSAPDAIIIEFKRKHRYLYTDAKTGAANVRELKRLAALGRGLVEFIDQASLSFEKLPDLVSIL
jgi:hypothetical protein